MRVPVPLLRACALVIIGGAGSAAQTPQPASQQTPQMEKVTGIGGFFFRSSDPKAMADWYERHLGVTRTPKSYDVEPWSQEKGWTVFGPFAADTKYFGRDTQQWMINFRVRDLDKMVAQLTRAGIPVEVDKQVYPNGRFALLHDPEGNPIQLWEPKHPAGGKTPGPD